MADNQRHHDYSLGDFDHPDYSENEEALLPSPIHLVSKNHSQHPNFGPEIGKRVAVRRRELGMTQRALSDQFGYTREMIAHIEGGRSEVNVGDLPRLCVVLSVPLAYFFENLVDPDDDGPMARGIRRLGEGVPKSLSSAQQWLLDTVSNLSQRDTHHLGVLVASMRDYDLLKYVEGGIERKERDRQDRKDG